jgi:DNA-3-methyladenine glycosylase
MESWSISSFVSASGRVESIRSDERRALELAPVLPKSFFERHTVRVAPELLGKVLLVRSRPSEPWDSPRAGVTAARIVETEAYRAGDPASHSARGNTPRTSVMFGAPGHAYVYFIYGMYEMLNFVTEPVGKPGAVLIRAVEPLAGERMMARRRKVRDRHSLTNGPGKLTIALGIRRDHNGASLAGPSLVVVDDGYRPEAIAASPRVGISEGQDKLWRFFIRGNGFVSRTRENADARALHLGTEYLK